jgi:NAD(P)-dependent dehydrogenase (short-subunit alcohol dehydrogenase family)
MSASGEYSGTKVVVIDAAEGVGPAVVDAFLDAGAKVAVDTPPSGDANGGAICIGKSAEPAAFLDACSAALDGLDVLVVSARPVSNKPALDVSPAEMRSVIEQDLVRPALFMQEAGRRMMRQRAGRIIAFASMSGKTGAHHNVGPFAAAKGGLLAYCRVLAAELAEHGVTVNGIATALFEVQAATMTEEKRTSLVRGIPVGRFGRASEAARAVLYLASRDAGFVTGECLNMSGGRFMD